MVFCDASGFTKLTEYLAQKPNGAELLSTVLNQFFTPLIEIINAYRGDIIKFSGDALTILFLAESEGMESSEYDLPCGSGWARCGGHSDLELAVLRASACCIEIHKRLDNFDTGIPDRTLSFHIGVGCGQCVVLHLGGEASPDDPKTKRFEYVICGEPLRQIAHACHYAEISQTVLSPEAWKLVAETVVEGPPIAEDPSYRRLGGLVNSRHTYATIRSAAQARDTRQDRYALRLSEMNLAKRYIPSAVYMQMENGTLEYVNEIRNVTVFFICVSDVDVSTPRGALVAQDLMCSVQSACFEQEGQVNKFLVDDKGLLFLCLFGTPPMVHTDDPLRAVHACFSIITSMKRLGLNAHFGLSTGRVFCGVVGSSARQEYTTLGDSVNLAARFMQLGHNNVVLVDSATYEQTKGDLDYHVLEPVQLKGKANKIAVFQPLFKLQNVSSSPKAASVAPKQLPQSPRSKQPGMLAYAFSVVDSFEDGGEAVRGSAEFSESKADAVISDPEDAASAVDLVGTTSSERRRSVVPPVEDPLVNCSSWKELKLTRRILDESSLIRAGGTCVFGGQSGLGKDQLCQVVLSAAKAANKEVLIVHASDQGQPRDRARPVVELIESCLGLGIGGETSGGKLDQLAALIDVPAFEIQQAARISAENGFIEVPELNSFVPSNFSNRSAFDLNRLIQENVPNSAHPVGLPNTAFISIGNSALSPSRGQRRGVRRSFFQGSRQEGEQLQQLNTGPSSPFLQEPWAPCEEQFIDYCERLVKRIVQERALVVVMKISRGTSLFNIVNNPTFWRLAERLTQLSHSTEVTNGNCPLTVVLLCRRTEDAQGITPPDARAIELQPLCRNTIEEYVTKILKLDVEGANNVPHELIDFVDDLTKGNPLYIMETLEQLIQRKFITRSVHGYVTVNCDLHKDVSVSEWSHTAMVGRVICQLEALAPQEAAIVKMATVFSGPFSVLDVAASLKSPYTNARRFDNYRMYRTCARLARLGIISEIPHLPQAVGNTLGGEMGGRESDAIPINDMSRFPKETDGAFIEGMSKIPMFILDNFLIRKVAGGMILQQQALKVKRQAMMFRVINKDVPFRMESQRKRVAGLHMPYYNLVKL